MYQIINFTDNRNIRVLDEKVAFTVVEYVKDLSVNPQKAQVA